MNIHELIIMVQKKNDLNRRRRRFYHHWTRTNSHMPGIEALAGYKKAQQDMKNMTPALCKARKTIGAMFVWSAGGMIKGIRCDEKYIHHGEYKKYIDAYCVENLLLGGNT